MTDGAGHPAGREAGRRRPGGTGSGLRRLWRRVGSRLRPWPLLAAVLGYVLGRGALLGYAGVFGLAWAAALRGAGSQAAAPAMLGVLGGMALPVAPNGPDALVYRLAQAATGLGLIYALNRPRAAGRPAGPAAAALGAAVAAAAGALATGLPGSWWGDWLGPAALATTAAVLTFIMFRGLRRLHEGRVAGLWEGQLALAALVLAVGVVAGLEGIRVGPVAPAAAAAAVAVMAAAWAGGPLAGAAAGLLAGLAGLLAGGAAAAGVAGGAGGGAAAAVARLDPHAVTAMVFGLSGVLGGAFRELGRAGVTTAFSMTYVLLRSLSDGQVMVAWGAAGDAAVAAGLLAVLPRSWVAQAGRWLMAGMPVAVPAEAPADAPGAAVRQLAALARVLREVHLWADREPGPEPAPPPPDAMAPIVARVADDVCRGCSLYRHCWEQEFYRTYQIFSDVWGTIEENGVIPAPLVPDALERHCNFPREVISAFNQLYRLHELQRRCDRRLADGRAAMLDQLQAMARLLDTAAEALAAGPAPAPAAPRFRVRVGSARMPKKGSHLSGDTYLAEPLGANRHLVAISDGMGGGRVAAAESQQALRLLQELLSAGYRLEAAVQMVNVALILRDAGDLFATLDVAVVDLVTARTEFAKVGAPPALLKRGRHVQVVRGESPPAGVIHPLPFESDTRALAPGDWLLLCSDGLWDRGRNGSQDGGRWLPDFLAGVDPAYPDQLAESVLARALEGEDEPRDDMTVVAVCLQAVAVDPPGVMLIPGAAGGRVGEPVPARRAPTGSRPVRGIAPPAGPPAPSEPPAGNAARARQGRRPGASKQEKTRK